MIRFATIDDVDWLADMSETFWRECGPVPDFDREYTENKLAALITGSRVIVDDRKRGFIILVYGEHLCAPVKHCCELAWYVHPNARGCGIKLLREAEKVAKLDGAVSISMVYLAKSMPDVVKSIYEKLGYTLSETTYLKVL